MNKNVLVGGGAGLVLLMLLGGFWLSARTPEPTKPGVQAQVPGAAAVASASDPSIGGAGATTAATPPAANSAASAARDASDSPVAAPAPGMSPTAPWPTGSVESISKTAKKPLTREERRAIRSQVRAKMTELLAKGQNATAEDAQAFINDVERLGQGVFEPVYFSTLREMIALGAQSQALSKELGQIANSTKPEAVARQQEILSEMRSIGERISNGAASLQSHAHDLVTKESQQ